MPKIAIVYDRVNKWGGAERVLLALHEIWPNAPLYTAVYNRKTARWADVFKIKTSYLNKIPYLRSHHEILPSLTPKAFCSFNFNQFDIVISVTSAEAKSIKVTGKTKHICYCLTPTRYLWSHKNFYENVDKNGIKAKMLRVLAPFLRIADYQSAQKVDYFIAISKTVQKRINKYYGKKSIVIYPPVNFISNNKFTKNKPFNNYYLVVSRLVGYKNIDLIIKTFNKLNKKLVIIGKGEELNNLKNIANNNIIFIQDLTDSELSVYYNGCQALIFASNEDFGIVPVEAQAHGKPVIAYAKGGALETVVDNKTGVFFFELNVKSLINAIKKFEMMTFNYKICINQANKFAKNRFKKQISSYVSQCLKN